MMKKDEWTLLALDLAGEKGLTPAQLQKVLFLIKQNYAKSLGDFYDFKPYNYGPFDKQVYVDAEILALKGYVELQKQDGHSWSMYKIRSDFAESDLGLRKKADPLVSNYLEKVIRWAQGLSFQQLIVSIYNKYPDYKVNSVFRG